MIGARFSQGHVRQQALSEEKLARGNVVIDTFIILRADRGQRPMPVVGLVLRAKRDLRQPFVLVVDRRTFAPTISW